MTHDKNKLFEEAGKRHEATMAKVLKSHKVQEALKVARDRARHEASQVFKKKA